jgi:hypothetical protein
LRLCCIAFVSALCLLTAIESHAQETIFNVPSGDVLDRGKVYGELDFTFRSNEGTQGYTPRVVIGAGHGLEIGLNVNGIVTPAMMQTTLSPTIKWKPYDGGGNGWAFFVGDDFFLPVQNRSYNAGNYIYAEFTKAWTTKTRVTLGGYHFTRDVVALAQRAGGQFAIEQPVSKLLTVAADWYTGTHALGYITPGIIVKATSKLTFYGSYQIGNSSAAAGNHQLLLVLGWNFN